MPDMTIEKLMWMLPSRQSGYVGRTQLRLQRTKTNFPPLYQSRREYLTIGFPGLCFGLTYFHSTFSIYFLLLLDPLSFLILIYFVCSSRGQFRLKSRSAALISKGMLWRTSYALRSMSITRGSFFGTKCLSHS